MNFPNQSFVEWRPKQISTTVLVLISIASLFGLSAVEKFRVKKKQPYYKEKIAAARLTEKAFGVIREERLRRGKTIDATFDPTQSGLIGELMTPITSNPGSLPAKQTSINPNFAAVAVDLLRRAGVREGDHVAVNFSGSFPALNIAVVAALETLKVKPVLTSSVSASQWGANDPEFLWVDMEKLLYDRKMISFRSAAASLGGVEDRGLGLSTKGKRLCREAIARNDIALLEPANFEESFQRHLALYREQAGDQPIKAFVNVGGGASSVGSRFGKKLFKPGLNGGPPPGTEPSDSLMTYYAHEGVPIIHFLKIEQMASTYGFALQPKNLPKVGEGKVFVREEYNVWLAGGVLALIFVGLYAFLRTEWGVHLLTGFRSSV